MKLSDQPYIPLHMALIQSGSQGAEVSMAPGKQQNAASGSNVEQDLSNERGRSSHYPMASEQEIHTRNKRAAFKLFTRRKPRLPLPPKPSVLPKPPKPLKPVDRKNGTKDVANSPNQLTELHNKNAFPPITRQLADSARSSFINHGVSALVGLPFSVGQYMASNAITDRIAAHAENNSAEGTTNTNDPLATEQQKLEARLEDAEIKTEVMINTLLSINEGPDANAVGKDPDAATDADSRLTALESRMTATESQMKEIAKRYGLIYEPYVPPESSQAPAETSRMEVIEKRYSHMNKMLKRLIRNAEADVEDAEG